MPKSYGVQPGCQIPLVIEEGTDWYELYALQFYDSGTTGIWPRIESGYTATFTVYPNGDATHTPVITLATGGSGITLATGGALDADTTLSPGVTTGAATLSVASATGIGIGDWLVYNIQGGTTAVVKVANIVGTTITLSQPSPGTAGSGSQIRAFSSAYFVHNIEIAITHSATSALTDWGDGIYQLDLIDSFGHVQRILSGPCILARGRDH